MDGKVNKKTYYYFSYVIESRFSTDENGEVLICGHAYHEECCQKLGLRCHHYYSYLATSIDELTRSYNNQLHMDEDINDEFDIKIEKQFEDCELDNAETINIPK
ncbi:hypothetical protein RhiirA5_382203 [Rhizophagus irregularis]|uniref:Uncharacterized protein n=1 Tax=Rhizophagus irregularis TaxID=588596 RepID=A0A2I1EEV4_9GLOM|nr:hypothetical protein RhiirA5_382203 [Rhizophagus irregularis]PKY20658.1 hypothetical protein RhiirB3_434016 [Rhizophagus irregularis]